MSCQLSWNLSGPKILPRFVLIRNLWAIFLNDNSVLSQNSLNSKFLWTKNFFGPTSFWTKIFFQPDIFRAKTILTCQFFTQNFCKPNFRSKCFGLKFFIFRQTFLASHFLDLKSFWTQIFWAQHLLDQNFFGPKFFLDQNIFGLRYFGPNFSNPMLVLRGSKYTLNLDAKPNSN